MRGFGFGFGIASASRLEVAIGMLNTITRKLEAMSVQQGETMATIEELETQVRESVGVEMSAVVLIQGLATKIQEIIDTGADPARLSALVDELNTSETALSEAIAANPVP